MILISKSNEYIKTMDAWDIGLLKTCMVACGVLLGTTMTKENKKKVAVASGITYVATAIAVSVPYIKFMIDRDESL